MVLFYLIFNETKEKDSMKLKLIIFDLDNTLINYGGVTKQAWDLTCTSVLKEFNLNIDALTLSDEIYRVNNMIWDDESRRPKGNFSFRDLRISIVKEALNNLNINNDLLVSYLVDNYDRCKRDSVYVFEDVFDTLKILREKGYTIALLTNGDAKTQREKLKRFDLEKLFDHIFIDGEQGVGKPEKAAYENVLNKCHVEAGEACMVGDHYLWEVVAPIQYGLHAIWVKRFGSMVPEEVTVQPDYTIENIDEILDLLS